MNIWYSLVVMGLLFVIALFGADFPKVFGVFIPYVAISVFILGIIYRVFKWAKSPVPFRIPTTSGQQKSLPWIKSSKLENPHTTWGVIRRMLLEILLFRSLFKNTKAELRDGPRLTYSSDKYLWLGAIVFHYCFLIIFLRHFRFFTEPVVEFVNWIQAIDGLFDITIPTLYLTTVLIVFALFYLLARRLFNPQVRYISLVADYFALFLIISVVITGIWMRYIDKVNIVDVKALAMGLFSFNPTIPDGIGSIFYMHLFFVCILIMYFPYSKLMHMAGVFLSPTRNLANTNRMQRHINPWNPDVKIHTYAEYEEEFRDKIKEAGLPLEKE